MSRRSEKATKEQPVAEPKIVDLRERVPQMSDDAVTTMLGNARRLIDTGSKLQRSGAAALMPILEAEAAVRAAVKAAATAKKDAAKKRRAAAVAKAS